MNYSQSYQLKGYQRPIRNTRRRATSRTYILLACFALVVSICSLWVYDAYAASSTNESLWIEVEVKHGDTIWKLVDRYYEGDEDVRKIIYEVKEINNLESSVITPRQILRIPLK
jgi:hypothetical protein